MMKLTLTLALGSTVSSSGFGVANGSGGAEASQLLFAAACIIAANFESCNREGHISRSRAAKANEAGPVETRNPGPMAEARQTPDDRATRRSEHNLRTGM
jgi:hypothetical protein